MCCNLTSSFFVQPETLIFFMLDEIIKDIESEHTIEQPEHLHEKEELIPEQSTTEGELYNAIMAKMNIRTSNVEETIRKGDVLRPQGEEIVHGDEPDVFISNFPSRHQQPQKRDYQQNRNADERLTKSFHDILEEHDLTFEKTTADSIVDNETLIKRLDEMIGKQSTKPRGKKGYSVEIEASYGLFGVNAKGHQTFYPGIKSHIDFTDLKHFLTVSTIKKGKKESPMFVSVDIEDVIELMKDADEKKGNIRCRYDALYPDDKIFERKIRNNKNSIEIREVGVRISYSTEDKSEDFSMYENKNIWKPHMIRNRRRTTFTTRDSTHPFYGFQIDVTAVSESYLKWNVDGEYEVEKKILKYEVEIEIMTSVSVVKTGREFLDFVMFVYAGLIGNTSPVSVENEVFFTMSDRRVIVNLHNALFADDIIRTKWKNNTGYTLFDKTYWNKPVNIKIDSLMPRYITEDKSTFHLASAYPTIKLNGKRCFLLFLPDTCWLMAPPFKIAKFASHSLGEKVAGTYIDGEFFKGTFHAFDILFDSGKDVRRLWFSDRQTLVKKYAGSVHVTPYFGGITVKKFYTKGDIYDRLREAATEYERISADDPDDVDGIIIQPNNEYNNKNTFKWKPAELLTIDFRMNPIPENMLGDEIYKLAGVNSSNFDRAFALTVGFDAQLFKPKPTRNADDKIIEFNGIIFVEDSTEHAKWVDTIAECKWEDNTFVPIKIRDDRFQPNNYKTALDVWVDIHNPIGLTTITGEDLVTMRKMHNRVKESTLRRFLKEGDTVVDIGSGRGGDLGKWRKLKLGKVFAIEPNETNAEEFIRRWESDKEKFKLLPNITLIDTGAEDTQTIKEKLGSLRLNAMVSFFSLTFFGEDEDTYNSLLETIQLIPPGGYFFGAVMDGERVGKLLSKERIKQSRSHVIINREIKEAEDEVAVLMKNPLRNAEKVKSLSTKIEALKEELYSYLPHDELKKMIKSTEKLITSDKKSLKKAGGSSRESERIKTTIKNREAYVQKLKLYLDEDEANPLEEDDVVIYNNGVFEIAQMSEFNLSNPTGNEISITISDPTSMVKDQIEWLFNFNVFTDRLKNAGFELIESRFIDGKDVQFLSKEAFTFSALNRVFCFKRAGGIEEVFPDEVDKVIPLASTKEKNMIIKAVPTKYGSFLHAILSAVDRDYQSLETIKEKDEYVLNLRKTIAQEVTLEEFQKLHAGEMAKRMAYQISKRENGGKDISDDEAMDLAFARYKERLEDGGAEVTDTSLLEVMSQRLDLAIYIIGIRDTDVITTYYYSSNKVYCNEVLDHKTSIILAKSDEFYLVGTNVNNEQKYIFTNKDTLIKKLYGEICGKEHEVPKKPDQKELKTSTFPINIKVPSSLYKYGFPVNKIPDLDDKKIVVTSSLPIIIDLSYSSGFLRDLPKDVNISKYATLEINPDENNFVLTSRRNAYTLHELGSAIVNAAVTQEGTHKDIWYVFEIKLTTDGNKIHLTQEANH